MHQRKIVLRFSTSYYDFSRIRSPKNWSKIILWFSTSYYDVTDFQSFNFESLSQQIQIIQSI